jgi:hypothetical protein
VVPPASAWLPAAICAAAGRDLLGAAGHLRQLGLELRDGRVDRVLERRVVALVVAGHARGHVALGHALPSRPTPR